MTKINFFQRYEELSRRIGSSPNAVAKELGLSSGSVTAWKNGTDPSIRAATKIAQYFNVSIDYLLTGRETGYKKEEEITTEEFLTSQGIEDDKLAEAIKHIIEMKKKIDNNTELANEFLKNGYGTN